MNKVAPLDIEASAFNLKQEQKFDILVRKPPTESLKICKICLEDEIFDPEEVGAMTEE